MKPIDDGPTLRERLLAGETLHHGRPPGEPKKRIWWLRPSMTEVTAAAVLFLREAPSPAPANEPKEGEPK